MIPAFFHKVSQITENNSGLYFRCLIAAITCFVVLAATAKVTHSENTILRFIMSLSGIALFWCIAIGGVWLSHRNLVTITKSCNIAVRAVQALGWAFQWIYSVALLVWFLALIALTFFVPINVLVS